MLISAIPPLPLAQAQITAKQPDESYVLPTLPEPIVQAALSVTTTQVISGHPVFIFSIPQVVNLVYPVMNYQGIPMLNYSVIRTDFRLLRGVKNEIVFFVRDIDRKPVTLAAGDSLTINIVGEDALLMTRNLTVVDSTKGIYQLATLPSEMDTWPTGPIRWSMLYNRSATNDSVMLWTDLSYSPYSYLYLTDGPLPGPAPTATILWADLSMLLTNNYYSQSLSGAAQDGYYNGVQTFVYTMTGFTGTVEIDATMIAQPDLSAESSDWFSVDSVTYSNFTGNASRNVVGNYLWLRMIVTPTSGTFVEAKYKV